MTTQAITAGETRVLDMSPARIVFVTNNTDDDLFCEGHRVGPSSL